MEKFRSYVEKHYRPKSAYVLIMAVRRLHDIASKDTPEAGAYTNLDCLIQDQGYERIKDFLHQRSASTRRNYCKAIILAIHFMDLDSDTLDTIVERYYHLETSRLMSKPTSDSSRIISFFERLKSFVCDYVCAWDG